MSGPVVENSRDSGKTRNGLRVGLRDSCLLSATGPDPLKPTNPASSQFSRSLQSYRARAACVSIRHGRSFGFTGA